jgi:hypothetical protein
MIRRIAMLDTDTYILFCGWLRKQGTSIGELLKESGVTQDRKLTEFILWRKEMERSESN